MKIRHKVIINSQVVTTYLVSAEDLYAIYLESGGKEGFSPDGLFDPRYLEIYISEDQCKQQLYSTWIHEIVEASNYLYRLKLEHDQIVQIENWLYAMGFQPKEYKENEKN